MDEVSGKGRFAPLSRWRKSSHVFTIIILFSQEERFFPYIQWAHVGQLETSGLREYDHMKKIQKSRAILFLWIGKSEMEVSKAKRSLYLPFCPSLFELRDSR